MKVIKYPKEFKNDKKVLLLGSFNSFHNGHLKLFEKANETKLKKAILIINSVETLTGIKKDNFHSLDVRLQHLSNIGFDYAIVVNLDSKVINTEGKEFANQLAELYNIKHFVIGEDFSMGKNSSYTAKELSEDFSADIVGSVKINDNKISTSLFKEFVEFGDVDLIRKLSPFFFTINARVSPNGEFKIDDLKPHRGVYAAWAIVNDVKYWSTIRISKEDHQIKIPDLLIKNSGYDVQIEFVKKIRSIIRDEFDNMTEEDSLKSLEYLKNHL